MSTHEDVQREREAQREHQREQQTLQQAFNQQDGLDKNFIEHLIDTEDIVRGTSDELDEVTITKIQNVLSQDVVLGNFTKAQEHDRRLWLECQKYKALGVHPPEESAIQGPVRAFLYDDPMEELQSLSQQERLIIHDFFEAMKDRVGRGREGFEREQLNTNIARTETEKKSDDDTGTFKGLFG